jgi:hypothetical protein
MGDHSASVKIEWSMHGHKDKMDMWVNYHPSDNCYEYKIDRRVLEWLDAAYKKSMDKWDDMQFEAEEERRRERRAAMSETEKRIEDLRREADEMEASLKKPTF